MQPQNLDSIRCSPFVGSCSKQDGTLELSVTSLGSTCHLLVLEEVPIIGLTEPFGYLEGQGT